MLRDDFPFFKARPEIVYLDNAATTQKPGCVIDSVTDFMTSQNSNMGRSLYPLSSNASNMVSDVRCKIASFINADASEIIFTKGSTEALSMVASSICKSRKKGNIVITELEHSSNYAPWLECCRRGGTEIRVAKVDSNGVLKTESVTSLIDNTTLAVSITGMSNVTGFCPAIKSICSFAKEHGALSMIDAAQLAVHDKVDVKEIGCDFLCLSGHKLYGPQGTGILYARKEAQAKLVPLALGGGAVESDYRQKKGPEGFEAGTQNIAGIVGLGKAIEYLIQHYNEIKEREDELSGYLFESLKGIEAVRILNTKPSSIVSFTIQGLGNYDIGVLLAQRGICIRTGSCCTYNLMRALKTEGVCRVSISFANTKEEIDSLAKALKEVSGRYGGKA